MLPARNGSRDLFPVLPAAKLPPFSLLGIYSLGSRDDKETEKGAKEVVQLRSKEAKKVTENTVVLLAEFQARLTRLAAVAITNRSTRISVDNSNRLP